MPQEGFSSLCCWWNLCTELGPLTPKCSIISENVLLGLFLYTPRGEGKGKISHIFGQLLGVRSCVPMRLSQQPGEIGRCPYSCFTVSKTQPAAKFTDCSRACGQWAAKPGLNPFRVLPRTLCSFEGKLESRLYHWGGRIIDRASQNVSEREKEVLIIKTPGRHRWPVKSWANQDLCSQLVWSLPCPHQQSQEWSWVFWRKLVPTAQHGDGFYQNPALGPSGKEK